MWGSVDFIFGAGRAVFDDCDIVSRDRFSKTNNGYVTAPSTPASQKYGFVFVNSRLKKEKPGIPANTVTLGRPWHPYANPAISSSAVFINTWMDDHIGAKGWDRMSSVDSAGTHANRPITTEFGTSGARRCECARARRVLSADEARRYSTELVFDGWGSQGVKRLPCRDSFCGRGASTARAEAARRTLMPLHEPPPLPATLLRDRSEARSAESRNLHPPPSYYHSAMKQHGKAAKGASSVVHSRPHSRAREPMAGELTAGRGGCALPRRRRAR